MARYIDADALTDYMLERYSELCDKYGDWDHYATGYGDAIDAIEEAPTADVVPKSEVAREIYVALYNEIIDARASNFDAIKEREAKHNVNRYEDGFCMYCDGKIHALEGILYFVEELIKKYTEGTNE